ncbi:MAG: tRNA (adenosine(37)-N6)-dimethylallyltransferase MiaA [Patescibacteria group bacterium]
MKYYIVAFGCQFNKADAERISQLFQKKGYKQSPVLSKADLVVILMCSVRQKSVDRIKNYVLNIKNINKKAKIILTGCVLDADKKSFEKMGVEIKKFKDLEKFPPLSGLITIGEGCDNFCAYCVVPYTRGREKYRESKAIIKETKGLIKNGVKEITLVAQNVNSYPNFTGLLQEITALPGDFKVKFLTNHPKDFSDELIAEMAKNNKIIKYVHLPFQSGDNEILRKMNRHYTRADYLKLIAKIRKAMPEVVITTDIIVGFPDETKKQFDKTIEVMKKAHFKQAYIAKYSPRAGTAAYHMADTVPAEEKARREQMLRKVINPIFKTVPLKIKNSDKLVVILGPTASGKTDLALKLAQKFNGEIVCADSRQIYREMTIGTASPFQTKNEKRKMKNDNEKSKRVEDIQHHLFHIIKPNQISNVAEYQKLAIKTIKDIQRRGKIPFLVGGTAFYIYSVVEGWQFPKLKANSELRQKLETQSPAQLFKLLKKLDKQRAKTIDKNNKRRLVRAIEMAKSAGATRPLARKPQFNCLLLGVNPGQKELERRIKKRIAKMFKQGLEDEVKTLIKKYGWTPILQNTIGYAEWMTLPSKVTIEKLINLHTRQFAKRQMTWFKRDKQIRWIGTAKSAEKEIRKFSILKTPSWR